MGTTMKYLKRITGLPFVMGIMLIGCLFLYIKSVWCYICYGGEWVTYANKDEQKMITDIYELLVKQNIDSLPQNKPNKKVIRKSGIRVPKEDKLAKNG